MDSTLQPSFSDSLLDHNLWGESWTQRLQDFEDWLLAQGLLDRDTQEGLERLRDQIKGDGLLVAFVAEHSRGKSELINALFFAQHGQRIMPTSAGRTTMCPTELLWDAQYPPCIRLLPIETRLDERGLSGWREQLNLWQVQPLDIDHPAQMAAQVATVSDIKMVPIATAKELGFWFEDNPDNNPSPNRDGLVEVPRWRHASINMPHPLLEKGLVLLDTPGLNAVGVEPELTLALLPKAQAILFILSADTGVTKSDLDLWRDHLPAVAKLAVLNKVDTLWDELRTPQQIEAEIQSQINKTAATLHLPAHHVIPVSAQKGLMAKIKQDGALLDRSGIVQLEQVLSSQILNQRQELLKGATRTHLAVVKKHLERVLQSRYALDSEQKAELRTLEGRSSSHVKLMLARVESERVALDGVATKLLDTYAQQAKQYTRANSFLSGMQPKADLAPLRLALHSSGLKTGLKDLYEQTFNRLITSVQTGESELQKVYYLLNHQVKVINTEYAFALSVDPPPEMMSCLQSVFEIKMSHAHHLGSGLAWKFLTKGHGERFMNALLTRLRVLFEQTQTSLDLWNQNATHSMQQHFKERHHAYQQRQETIERITNKSDSLSERITAIELRQDENKKTQQAMRDWVASLSLQG